jgi:hypothetical protein
MEKVQCSVAKRFIVLDESSAFAPEHRHPESPSPGCGMRTSREIAQTLTSQKTTTVGFIQTVFVMSKMRWVAQSSHSPTAAHSSLSLPLRSGRKTMSPWENAFKSKFRQHALTSWHSDQGVYVERVRMIIHSRLFRELSV